MSAPYLFAAMAVKPRNRSEHERMDLDVLHRLGDHANKNGVAWPSERTVSDEMPLERGALRLSLLRLVQAGRIRRLTDQAEIKRLAPERKGGSSVYLLLLEPKREPEAPSVETKLDAVGVEVGAERPAAGCRRPPDPIREPIREPSEHPREGAQGTQSTQMGARSTRPPEARRDPEISRLEARRKSIPALHGFRDAWLGESAFAYCQAQEDVCARWEERNRRDSNTIPDALRESRGPPGPQRVGEHLRRAARTAPPLRRAAAGHVTVRYVDGGEELQETPEAPIVQRIRQWMQVGEQLLLDLAPQAAGSAPS